MKEQKSPYICHILVCTNCRDKDKKSCSQGASEEIMKSIKLEVKDRGWKDRVRLLSSNCMGICTEGPNVMLHPQNVWFSKVTVNDVDAIMDRVKMVL